MSDIVIDAAMPSKSAQRYKRLVSNWQQKKQHREQRSVIFHVQYENISMEKQSQRQYKT